MNHDDRPPTPDELDDLARIRKDSTRFLAFAAIALAVILLVVVAIAVTIGVSFRDSQQETNRELRQTTAKLSQATHQLAMQEQELSVQEQSDCSFYSLLGGLPVVTSGPQKTSSLGVKLLVDSRNAYANRGCRPVLMPPSPALVSLASSYRIRVPH